MFDLSKLELGAEFVYSVSNVSLSYILNNIAKDIITVADCEDKKIPVEVSVYKLIKGFPINVVATAKRVGRTTQWVVVKGNQDLENIIKWIRGEVSVTIQGRDVDFDSFDESDKKYLLNEKHSIISTIVDFKKGSENGMSAEDLMELVRFQF